MTTAGPWATAVGLLALVYGPHLLRSMRRAATPLIVNDDARQQIFPFFRYMDASLFPSDYIGDYYLDAFLPTGYRWLYRAAATLWDPTALSATLPYLLLGVLLAAVAAIAHRLGGVVAAFFSMAMCLTGASVLLAVGGGLPRGFAFPVLACGLAALVYGRPGLTLASIWAGAAFYPVAGLVLGMTTSVVWLLLPARDLGRAGAWPRTRRLVALAAAAAVSMALLAPTVIGARPYGRFLTAADAGVYPEVGAGGRYQTKNVAPWPGYLAGAAPVARRAILGHGKPWTPLRRHLPPAFWTALLVLTTLGWLRLVAIRPGARIVTAFAAAAAAGYTVACEVAPYLYLPPRYVMYPVPLVCALAIPAALVSLGDWAGAAAGRPRLGPIAAAVAGGALLLAVGGYGDPALGLRRDARRSAKLFAAIERLPPDALIAGFPRGHVNDIPLLARRQVLMSYETHQVFHEAYVLEMRRRLRAFLDAYYATDPKPIRRLHREFGVTHILVDRDHLERRPPGYFKPLGKWVSAAYRRARGRALLASPRARDAVVFRRGRVELVDLAILLDRMEPRPDGRRRSRDEREPAPPP